MDAKMRKEVDQEVDEKFNKYLEEHKKDKKGKMINWYKILAIFIMASSLLLAALSIYVLVTS